MPLITDFAWTGNDQFYTVPEGTTSLLLDLWAGGGGNYRTGLIAGTPGVFAGLPGGGSHMSCIMPVTSGETLKVMCGSQGLNGDVTAVTDYCYGWGGPGTLSDFTFNFGAAGGGGGMTAVWRSAGGGVWVLLAAAGGGGGAAGGESGSHMGGAGGQGGGTTGQDAPDGGAKGGKDGGSGGAGGGHDIAAGPSSLDGFPAISYKGGSGGYFNSPGAHSAFWAGGGGGGGYQGGGGGGCGGIHDAGAGGGGGLSFTPWDGLYNSTSGGNMGNGHATITAAGIQKLRWKQRNDVVDRARLERSTRQRSIRQGWQGTYR